MIFVVGTHGTKAENVWAAAKARYDAETFWYQGNGSVDIISDDQFIPARYPDRSVILYGNAVTNRAWEKVLPDCPVKVVPGAIIMDNKILKGSNLAALFIWPRKDSKVF